MCEKTKARPLRRKLRRGDVLHIPITDEGRIEIDVRKGDGKDRLVARIRRAPKTAIDTGTVGKSE